MHLTIKRLINLSALHRDTTRMCRIRLGGSGGMLPQENFLKVSCSEMVSETFFGPSLARQQNSLHDHMHGDWCPSAYTHGTGQRSGTRKPVNILLLRILFRATPVKIVWSPRSQSACSQVSAYLFYARTVKFVGTQICVGDMRVSCLQAKGHLCQNKGLAIAGSVRPASPALSERNECVKDR